MNESIVVFGRFRFLKWALVLSVLAIIAYVWHHPLVAPNGGTWLGYTLGILSFAIILWLMYFGIRKRTYGAGHVRLEAWLSAHVYLGLSLIVLATLHTGFKFGWNVHTLAYVLMWIVILSGIFGLYAYLRYPRLMTMNRRGVTLDNMLAQIAEVDRECRQVGMPLGDEINRSLLDASQHTSVGGGLIRQLSGQDPNCPTEATLRRVETLANASQGERAAELRQLVMLLTRKVSLLQRARRDVQLTALMKVWVFVHVPLSFALLAALITHIVSVFFYW
ncbi:MAG TPA: hypothetical protein VMU42_10540 [Candidatus Sulfotelmatobacter sp.]|nr:hypothetical protein [Candidatus Sulfotelmatobacter sp.]